MKRKSFMKKLTSLVLCTLMIVGNGVVFGASAIPASDPSVAPGSDWNLVKVIDFERDDGFTLEQSIDGSSYAKIAESDDVPTGWYSDNTGATGVSNGITYSQFPTLTQDAVSVKFKLYVPSNFGNVTGSADAGKVLRFTLGPAGFMVNSSTAKSNAKAFILSSNNNGWGSKPFKNSANENICYKDGWNDIEIRLFKDTSGTDNPFTRAEYYFNGVQGTVSNVSSGLNAAYSSTPISSTGDKHTFMINAGGNKAEAYKLDEIYVYDKNTSALIQLESPTDVSLTSSGGVTFTGVDNANSYDVKLYKDGTLIRKTVVLSTETTAANFVDDILNSGAGTYCASVQANGDFTTYSNSAVVYSADVASSAAFRTYALYDFERDNLAAGKDSYVEDGSLDNGDTIKINEDPDPDNNEDGVKYGVWTYVQTDADTPTGQYLYNHGPVSRGWTRFVFLPNVNSDAVSLKFKFYASDDWTTAYPFINFGPAGMSLFPKQYTLNGNPVPYTGKFCGSIGDDGWGSVPFKDADGNEITYNNGWNDIEIRLFKAVPGTANPYTSAEYYFNGVKATSSAQTNGLNTSLGNVADTSTYQFGIRCGGSGSSPYRIDDIQICDLSADTTTKLSAPASATVGGGATVNFERAADTNYSVKLYDSNNVLKATKTVLASDADTSAACFGAEIYNLGIGDDVNYTFKVNAKGDYSTTANSDEVTVTENTADYVKYGPYLVSGFESSAKIENGNLTLNAGTNVLRGAEDEEEAPYTFITALYKDGSLADVNICILDETEVATVGASKTLSGKVSHSATGYSNTAESLPEFTAKIFSWNSCTSLKPIDGIDLRNLTKQNIFDMLSEN